MGGQSRPRGDLGGGGHVESMLIGKVQQPQEKNHGKWTTLGS